MYANPRRMSTVSPSVLWIKSGIALSVDYDLIINVEFKARKKIVVHE